MPRFSRPRTFRYREFRPIANARVADQSMPCSHSYLSRLKLSVSRRYPCCSSQRFRYLAAERREPVIGHHDDRRVLAHGAHYLADLLVDLPIGVAHRIGEIGGDVGRTQRIGRIRFAAHIMDVAIDAAEVEEHQ